MSDIDVVAQALAILREHDTDNTLLSCDLRAVVIGSDVLGQVPDLVADLLRPSGTSLPERPEVALIVDRTPIRRHAADVKAEVAQVLSACYDVRWVVLSDGHPELHADEAVIARATAEIAGVHAVVTVGGGTITDIGKLASRDAGGLPLVTVQTAASVDGFTDNVSVILRNGVKRTIDSRWPDVVVADVETIAQAPISMNLAGYGEINSMFTAPADWRLAQLLGIDDSFHSGPIRLLDAVGEDLEVWSAGLGRETASTQRLVQALALRGIATGVSGSTACLSGVEHLISHMFDLWHGQQGAPIGLHGAQVGVASVVAAAAWDMLFDRMATVQDAASRFRIPTAAELEPQVLAAFAAADPSGRIGAECWADVKRKLAAVTANRDRIGAVLADWSTTEAELRPLLLSPESIGRGLVSAGAAARFGQLVPAVGPDLVRWAARNSWLMRNRFTVVDLLALLGWWSDGDVAEVLDRAELAVTPAAVEHG